MLLSLKELTGFAIQAQNGEIGKVNDFYFDGKDWVVRYLIDKMGFGPLGRQVLIAPASIEKAQWDQKNVLVSLLRGQVEKSPSIDQEKLLSKDAAQKQNNDEQWPSYMIGSDLLNETDYSLTVSPLLIGQPMKRSNQGDKQSDEPNLHSCADVMGYQMSTNNGDLGFVDDFIVDDKNWAIHYLVIDAKKGLGGKKILIAPDKIDWISWKKKKVSVSMDKEKIRACPNFDLSLPVKHEYEALLYEQYECA